MNWSDIGRYLVDFGGIAGVLALVNEFRKRKRVTIDQGQAIANSAVKLIDKLQLQADTLQKQLMSANSRADDLSEKLRTANNRADDLQEKHDALLVQLGDAQTDMRHMRLTIKSLSSELEKRVGDNPWRSP